MKCENCGEEHDGSYGSGRFCSAHCRRVWIGKRSVEKRKRTGKFKSPFADPNFKFKRKKAVYGTWICRHCESQPVFETRKELQKHRCNIHPELVKEGGWNKGLTKETDARVARIAKRFKEEYATGKRVPFFKGRKHSIESRLKMSKAALRGYKNGTRVGWKSRRIVSFPEQFWKQVLDNNNIKYDFNFPISQRSLGIDSSKYYFLDFKIGKNIDLEIDGAQHRYRKDHDKKRNQYLTQNGYKVYRIPWNDVVSEAGKQLMKQKIQNFLTWLNINMQV